jgi:hypothetical protein
MALETLKAEIALLVAQMENQPRDRRELHLVLVEKLNEMRAFGLPLPPDLIALEAALDREISREQAPRYPGLGEAPRRT